MNLHPVLFILLYGRSIYLKTLLNDLYDFMI